MREVEEKGEDSAYLARKNLSIVGILTKKSVKTTKNGGDMAFVTLEDRQGEIEAVLFPKVFDAIGAELIADTPFLATGSLSCKEDELPKILVNRISPIRKRPPRAVPTTAARLCLKVDRLESPIGQKALAILERFPGEVPVAIYAAAQKKYFQPKHITVDASEALLAELSRLLSKSNVVLQ
jgi:DNA polymerase-3 subunit alpha